jgi:ABC-type transport system involved in multi-copper enzyme maturation permease subunit
MNALPMVRRELRAASRQWKTYWMRFGFGFAFAFAGGTFLLGNSDGYLRFSQMGTILFGIMSVMAFVFSVVSGLSNTSDCISEEKREGTLGLLFLTDLSGWDVVMGKFFAKGLLSLNSILAGLPVMTLCLLFGGLTLAQFVGATLVIINAFFFSHAAGLISSSLSVKQREAHLGAFCLVSISVFIAPVIDSICRAFAIPWGGWFSLLCVWRPLVTVFDPMFSLLSLSFAGPLLVTHGIAWLFLAFASWETPRSWQVGSDKPKMSIPTGASTVASPSASRPKVHSQNPYSWLILRGRRKWILGWFPLVLLIVAWSGLGLWLSHQKTSVEWEPFFYSFIGITSVVFRILMALEAVVHFEGHRFDGSLEYLLSTTPLTTQEIVNGKLMVIKRLFLKPVATLLVLNSVILLGIMVAQQFRHPDNYAVVAALIALLPLEMMTTAWIGMWRGMKSKKVRNASGETLLMIFGVPWITYASILIGVVYLRDRLGFGVRLGDGFHFFAWLLSMSVMPILMARMGRKDLLKNFRLYANPLYDGSFRIWRWIGKSCGRMIGQLNRLITQGSTEIPR